MHVLFKTSAFASSEPLHLLRLISIQHRPCPISVHFQIYTLLCSKVSYLYIAILCGKPTASAMHIFLTQVQSSNSA